MYNESEEQTHGLNQLDQVLIANGNVMTIKASEIRDAYGVQRLGAIVRQNITQALRRRAISHIPTEFPDRQDAEVRLYKHGTEVGQVIEAAFGLGQTNDEILRNAAGDSAMDAESILLKIRELVCE